MRHALLALLASLVLIATASAEAQGGKREPVPAAQGKRTIQRPRTAPQRAARWMRDPAGQWQLRGTSSR